jgi:hypothetical protein
MKRSGIRGGVIAVSPDSTAFHPGYDNQDIQAQISVNNSFCLHSNRIIGCYLLAQVAPM